MMLCCWKASTFSSLHDDKFQLDRNRKMRFPHHHRTFYPLWVAQENYDSDCCWWLNEVLQVNVRHHQQQDLPEPGTHRLTSFFLFGVIFCLWKIWKKSMWWVEKSTSSGSLPHSTFHNSQSDETSPRRYFDFFSLLQKVELNSGISPVFLSLIAWKKSREKDRDIILKWFIVVVSPKDVPLSPTRPRAGRRLCKNVAFLRAARVVFIVILFFHSVQLPSDGTFLSKKNVFFFQLVKGAKRRTKNAKTSFLGFIYIIWLETWAFQLFFFRTFFLFVSSK